MIFASRTPHDIVQTPEDDALIEAGDFCYEEVYGLVPSKFYHEANPILVAFRQREDVGNLYARRQWRNFLRSGWDGSICKATAEEEAHARAVFERWDEVARRQAIDELLEMEDA